MDLTWLGHAAVHVKSGNNSMVMDPFPEQLGLRIPPQHAEASVVTLSAEDPNVSAVDAVTGERKAVVIRGPGEYEASEIHIRGIRTSRYVAGGQVGWNTVYTAEVEGMVICHLGDPDRLLTRREIEALGSPHILVLPVGSPNGLSPADAVEMISAISPRIVLPVLFAHPGNKTDLREIAPFVQELGSKPAEQHARLTVTRATLPEETQVSVLDAAGTLI